MAAMGLHPKDDTGEVPRGGERSKKSFIPVLPTLSLAVLVFYNLVNTPPGIFLVNLIGIPRKRIHSLEIRSVVTTVVVQLLLYHHSPSVGLSTPTKFKKKTRNLRENSSRGEAQ